MKRVGWYNFFSMYAKMSETTYHQGNREIILNRAKDFYEKSKEQKEGNMEEIDIIICLKKTKKY